MDILTGGKKMTISLEQIESKLSEGGMQKKFTGLVQITKEM